MGATVLSALTDVQLGALDFDVPSDWRCLLAVMPTLTSPAGNTAAEAVAASLKISANVPAMGDCQMLAHPIGSSLLKSVAQIQGWQETAIYPINQVLKGGEKLKFYGTGLFDHTIEPYMGVTIWGSDFVPEPLMNPRTYWILGTLTAMQTAASTGEKVGSKISIIGGKRIIEVGGLHYGTTVAALKGLLAKMRLNSSDIIKGGDIEYFLEPASGQVDTNIQEAIAGVTRIPCSIPIKDKCTLVDYHNTLVALTTAGKFIAQVGYI
jgi:hypothetical protein